MLRRVLFPYFSQRRRYTLRHILSFLTQRRRYTLRHIPPILPKTEVHSAQSSLYFSLRRRYTLRRVLPISPWVYIGWCIAQYASLGVHRVVYSPVCLPGT